MVLTIPTKFKENASCCDNTHISKTINYKIHLDWLWVIFTLFVLRSFSLNLQLHNMVLCNWYSAIAIHPTIPFIYENSFLLIDLTWLGLEKNQLQSHINIWQQFAAFWATQFCAWHATEILIKKIIFGLGVAWVFFFGGAAGCFFFGVGGLCTK